MANTNKFPSLITFNKDQVNYVDEMVYRLKKNGWQDASRAAFVRATIRATKEKRLDIKGIKNEDELTNLIISNA